MIYIIEAPPGYGKTYYATKRIIEELKKKKPKKVFSNYPVIIKHKGKLLSSYKWEPEYLYEGVSESEIYLDEAWQYFSSREWKKFDVKTQEAFATNRHNENNYYLIAQHHSRLDTIIREICGMFYVLHKVHIGKWPLWFTVDSFLTEGDVEKYHETKNKELRWSCKRFLRSRVVEKAYDTHFWRRDDGSINPRSWIEELIDDQKELSNLIWDMPAYRDKKENYLHAHIHDNL